MPLAYYGKWTVGLTVGTTAQLVANADGDCNAWAKFFSDVVRVQGVTLAASAVRSIAVDPNRLNLYDATRFPVAGRMLDQNVIPIALMLVKGWALTGGDATNTAKLVPGPVDIQNKTYVWEPNPHVKFTSSVPVQGNTRPLALFNSHTIVQITYLDPTTKAPMTILFDPSYGTVSKGTGSVDTDLTGIKAQSRLLSWQKQSLDFVGLYYQRPDTAAPAYKADLRMTAISAGTGTLFMKYQ